MRKRLMAAAAQFRKGARPPAPAPSRHGGRARGGGVSAGQGLRRRVGAGRFTRTMALFAAAVTLSPGLASAQQTAVNGPLRMVGGNDTFVGMIAPAQPGASGSNDVWFWIFYRDLKNTYAANFDTTAEHQRIDCAQRTVTPLRLELFRENAFLGHASPPEPFTPQPNTLPAFVVAAVCDPGFEPEATFPDAVVARAVATRHFARQQAGSASGAP